jgi:ABC-type Zn uptake system ZnuABC Zn-binding protein ZnuA
MMKRAARAALFLSMALVAFCQAATAPQRLAVVTTTSDLKSLVEAVAGDRVQVTSLVPPAMDAEDYQPRPQDLARLKEARMVVRVGLDYDLWLDRLLQQADRPALRRGREGHVDASFAVALLELRGAAVGDQGGHAHGSGNPHYWLDPANAQIITGTMLQALVRLDPSNGGYYEARRIAFLDRLATRLLGWEEALAPLRGRPLLAYHNSWAYFARRFRLNIAGTIEPKAGVPPSSAHLGALLRTLREQRVRLIVKQPFEPDKVPAFLAERTGGIVVVLAASVGSVPEANDYFALFDFNVRALLRALRDAGS